MSIRHWYTTARERLYALPLVVLAVIFAIGSFAFAFVVNVAVGVPVIRDGVLGAALICVVGGALAAWGTNRRRQQVGKF
ncbi:MAG TPA: hypothetical protein VGH69_07260 [Mycobacterium sp.]|jgi:uncharacterized membrane protein YidH (DUF202 family)